MYLVMWKVKCVGLSGEDYLKLIITNHMIRVKVSDKLHELYADGAVKKRAGIFEYILGGCKEPSIA